MDCIIPPGRKSEVDLDRSKSLQKETVEWWFRQWCDRGFLYWLSLTSIQYSLGSAILKVSGLRDKRCSSVYILRRKWGICLWYFEKDIRRYYFLLVENFQMVRFFFGVVVGREVGIAKVAVILPWYYSLNQS